ncbi:MAG: LLM class flavin-dependent oxidoreductase [Flavobacteriaceae bacterium]|jgi:probable LLM family oxidoreductase|nr:LLM class flavin-dependent oxidoreductase [Flavobacteriaceae bacterium]
MVQFGIGMFGDVQIDESKGYIQPAQDRLREIVEEVKLMDKLGLDFFGIGEHHREDYAVASPEILLASLSTVTQNIRLGSAVSVISSTDPVKLFQDFATVDLLSNGRAEIMAGRGSFIESFPLFGLDLKDYDALFDEKLKLLVQLNKEKVVTWSGEFRKPLYKQEIFPRPQQEQLPVWVAVGGTPASVIRAGKLGLPVMFAIIGGDWRNFKPLFEYYEQAYLDNGHDPDRFQVGVHMHSFFGEDSSRVADSYYPVYSAQMDRVGRSRNWPPYQRPNFDYGRSENGHLLVGGAEESAQKIATIVKELGITRFSAHMDVGSPKHQDMMNSIKIYAEQIVPRVKELLK